MKLHKWAVVHGAYKVRMCARCGLTAEEVKAIGDKSGCEEEPSRYLAELETNPLPTQERG